MLPEVLLSLALRDMVNPEIPDEYYEEVPIIFTERQEGVDESFSAGYCRGKNEIYLYVLGGRGEIQGLLTHEIGHKKCYDEDHPDVFGRGIKHDKSGDFVSRRAMKSAKEDCAETFRAFYESNICAPWSNFTALVKLKCYQIMRWHKKAMQKK